LPISVVVRSYKRPGALLELVGRLRSQRYPTFEVVILEQSEDPELVSRITSADDPRIRVIVSPQRDPPAARNEAVRHATGNVLLFIDDDDLPIGSDWIALHARNYADPRCMGVVGRAASDPEGKKVPKFPWIIRALAMRHTFFKDTVSYAHNTLRKESVDFLIGTNASVRRTLIDRIGGWDEGIPMHEEQSFAIKFHRQHRSGERFVFDPGPIIQRRTDLPGGLSRRTRDDWYAWELEARLFYYEQVVGHYFPIRYRLLCPLFVLRALEQAFFWIWDPDNAHWSLCSRLRASIDLLKSLPRALRFERFPAADVRRVTRIARYIAPGHGTSLPARRELRTPAMD
jgi:glycosyltransferase involved in cell wall biosynthesis